MSFQNESSAAVVEMTDQEIREVSGAHDLMGYFYTASTVVGAGIAVWSAWKSRNK